VKVVLTYRVLQHWRTPVFQRLAKWPGISFCALYGADFPGTQVSSGSDLSGFKHRRLLTIPLKFSRRGEAICMPLCPTLPFHLARERPAVILAEGGSNLLNNLLVFAYAGLTRTPVVWWTLGEIRRHGPVSLSQRIFRRIVVMMERRSASLLGYSSVALDYFGRHGYPEERQFRAVNCVDTERVIAETKATAGRVAHLRRQYGLEGKQVLLFVGALVPGKRLEDLIAVYAILRRRHPELRLMIVGDGSHRSVLEREARETGAGDVIFTGRIVDDVHAHFELGDIFALPGLGGLAVSEAMAHGLPVIATEADGCEVDLVEEGKNGYLLPVGDRGKLEACLDMLLSDPRTLESMKRHSRWMIENRFNIHTYMENVVAAVDYAYTERRRGVA
jgi:glycosyltransferase involved in cell wall biosynthesis